MVRAAKKYQSPYQPAIKSELDDSNFDAYDEDDRVLPYKGDQSLFASF